MGGREIIVRILGDASQFDKATKQATTSASKFSNVLTGIGQGAGIAAFANVANVASMAAGAVVDFVGDSIKAASNLSETIAKSSVIFGDGSDAVIEWAKAAADSMGLSQRAALDAASGFAGLFKTVGIGLDEATEMSQDITALGADMASFFNTDMATALAALKSGLNGESEPLRQFNVFLSETAVTAKLAQMGIKKTGGAFTEAQKATARYALIMEQTGDAQGDFARTSDGLANTQRSLAAEVENLQANIGEDLLPVMIGLMTFVKDTGVPAIGLLSDTLSNLGTGFDILADTTVDVLTPWDEDVHSSIMSNRLFDRSLANTTGNLGAFSTTTAAVAGRVVDAITGIATTTTSTARDIGSATDRMTWDWKTYAEYLLGSVTGHFDTAMAIMEARADLHDAKSTTDHIRARLRLLELGALSKSQAIQLGKDLEALAKSTKGAVHREIDAAIADYKRLQAAALPITVRVNYVGSGKVAGIEANERAAGGAASGLTWVGEKGPELVNLPAGSYVNSAAKSRGMAGGGVVVNINEGAFIDGPSIDRLTNMIAQRLNYATGR